MRAVAIAAALSGAVAAQGNYGYAPAAPAPAPSSAQAPQQYQTQVVYSTAVQTITSCSGGCAKSTSTPCAEEQKSYAHPTYSSSSSTPVYTSVKYYTKAVKYTPSSSYVAPVPSSSINAYSAPVCPPPSTVTVTVTAGQGYPPVSSATYAPVPVPISSATYAPVPVAYTSQAPKYPVAGTTTAVYYPTGTGYVRPSYSPSAYMGSASSANAGVLAAGLGAIAAFFL